MGKWLVLGKEVETATLGDAVDHFGFTKLRCWGLFFGNWYIGVAHAKKAK